MTEMLGAACAAGVACNFGAPTGAVLFSIEVRGGAGESAVGWPR